MSDPEKTGPIGINSFNLMLIDSFEPDLLPPASEGDIILAAFDDIYDMWVGDKAEVAIGGELAWYPPDEEDLLQAQTIDQSPLKKLTDRAAYN